MSQQVETIIVGVGQAGLATSFYLTQRGREHLVLEQAAQAANAWRNDRWDSFTLLTPNWSILMPGAEYHGPASDGFMSRSELVSYFEQYAQQFHLPLQYNTCVTSIEPGEKGYLVKTNAGTFTAANVVIATGLFQQPKIPPYSANLPAQVVQMHSGKYRNPESLPPGAVLVVGSAQSGCQIAEELYQSGRKVYLSVGSAGRAPRRYRGKDVYKWLHLAGFLDRTPDKLPSPQARFAANPQVSGKNGGHTINLHQFVRDGCAAEIITELDLKAAGISTVIWATGYRFDFSLAKLPVLDDIGFPVQLRGVTRYAGLYFIGLPWLYKQKSGLLVGVGEDTAYLAEQIGK